MVDPDSLDSRLVRVEERTTFLRDGYQELKSEVREIGKDVREMRAMVERVPTLIEKALYPIETEIARLPDKISLAVEESVSPIEQKQLKIDFRQGAIVTGVVFIITVTIQFGLALLQGKLS